MKATAYLVTPGEGSGLAETIRPAGFEQVRPYAGVAQAERQARRTPVCFFLFGAVAEPGRLRSIAEAIRFSASRRIRFSPLIYFAENPSLEIIASCINMGFDDVITLPVTPDRVADRINRQIGSSLTYYETASYFGPDRRGRLPGAARAQDLRGGGPFRRLEIVRHLETGVKLLSDHAVERAGLPDSRRPAPQLQKCNVA